MNKINLTNCFLCLMYDKKATNQLINNFKNIISNENEPSKKWQEIKNNINDFSKNFIPEEKARKKFVNDVLFIFKHIATYKMDTLEKHFINFLIPD